MSNGIPAVPTPVNEPVKDYRPGSPERESLQATLSTMMSEQIEIPLTIGGEKIFTGNTRNAVCPHNHAHVLAKAHRASSDHVNQAIEAARRAHPEWSAMPWESRAAVFLKAAALLSGPYRDRLNAATMLNQSKNVHQAEIDSAAELVDFWNFNSWYAQQIYEIQPPVSPVGTWNTTEQRAMEGFIFAVCPFNFTSIAGNLPTAPALMGNTVLWKPAETAILSAHVIMEILEEAGLPPGVINLVPGPGREIGPLALAHPELAGIHFTGSTGTFHNMWRTVGTNIDRYHSYPRLVGETGGKDFIFAHESADRQALATAMVRGAFEYQGQKCSAASRVYVPANIWDDVWQRAEAMLQTIRVGDPTDFGNFMNAVIDEPAFDKITGYIDQARSTPDAKILFGGTSSKQTGYFIDPTVIKAEKPDFITMKEEIFGPVLSVYTYDPNQMDEALELCDKTSPYALTGAIFAQDRRVIVEATQKLTHTAGNFYINDKPTGAVVGQQPFGGGRASGTNDKAGSMLNLLRWVNQRAIKETFVPAHDYRYPWNQS